MGPRRVLLVDDNELIRDLVATTLGLGNFTISMADDGPTAIQVARRDHPDVIFLDVAMPGMDGVEVCRTLRQDPSLKRSIIVMLTARASKSDKERGLAAGANAYVIKPFSPLALRRLIDELSSKS